MYLETFGCQMNVLDSELAAGALRALGYRFVDDSNDAGVILYNTCSVRDHAEQKVRSRLGEMAVRKRREPSLVVGVLGCMAERDGQAIFHKSPVVDVLCGPSELDKLPALLDNAVRTRVSLVGDRLDNNRRCNAVIADRSAKVAALQGGASRRSATLSAAADHLELLDLSRAISPSDHNGSAYVRITRGCNKFCTYCVVPYTRGAETHRPPDHIVDECKRLADAGVLEITLLGQTVNHYRFEHGASVVVGGVTQPQKGRAIKPNMNSARHGAAARVTTFADLLKRVHDEVPAIKRLRFVTSYPRDFTDDALQVMRDSPRICRYLHAPAQSGSDAALTRMNRGYTVSEYMEFVDRARSFLDEPEKGRPLMLAGDIIVGFSGETEAEFHETLTLLERVRYKSCFIFKYSPRPGTAAFDRLPDDVPDEVKRRRNNEALALQHTISDEISQGFAGDVVHVFVEGVSAQERKRQASEQVQTGKYAAVTIGGDAVAGGAAPVGQGAARRVPINGSDGRVQMTGRTDGDMIVHFDAPAGLAPDDLVGRIVPVRIERASVLSLFGALA